MPMAAATMPPSAIGVSKQRVRPCFFCKPVGDAEHAAEIADILAEDQHVRVARQHHVERRVERLDHVHRRHGQTPSLLALAAQMPGHLLEHVLEHRLDARRLAVAAGCRWLSASALAARTCSTSSCACAAACCSSSHSPSAIRCCFSRSTGSPSGQRLAFVGRAIAARDRRWWNGLRRDR